MAKSSFCCVCVCVRVENSLSPEFSKFSLLCVCVCVLCASRELCVFKRKKTLPAAEQR